MRPAIQLLVGVMAALGVAQASAIGVVAVNQPWVRPAAARSSAPAYLVLQSSVDAVLVAVRSPSGDVALVRGKAKVAQIAVRAGEPLALRADGPHLLLRPAAALRLGDRVALTLVLRDADGKLQEIPVNAEVRQRSPLDDERREHGRGHHH